MVDEDNQRKPFIKYLEYDDLPEEKSLTIQLKKRSMRFIHINDVLQKRSYNQQLLQCFSKKQHEEVMHEAYSGIYGAHQS